MNKESGRTLVETLAMLAIMGILSVVGMAGYNAAMDKNRANTILSEAQKRATLVVPQILLMNNSNPTITEFVNNDFGYGTFDTTVYTKSNLNAMPKNAFAIKVSNVPKNVCRNILNTIGDKTPIRRLSLEETPTLPITECNDDNTFLMIYNDDMLGENKNPPQSCHSHSDCGECGTCKKENEGDETGVCVGECESACSTQDECGENDCVVCDDETKTCQNKCDEVEYLESNGSQYIDTGVVGNEKIILQIKIQPTELYNPSTQACQMLAGSFSTVSNSITIQPSKHTYSETNSYINNRFGTLVNSLITVDDLDTEPHTYTISSNGISVDEKLYTWTGGTSKPFSTILPIYIGRISGDSVANLMKNKIYTTKIYDNNRPILDFIPVLSPQIGEEERKACMFDKVSKKLFCGTGAFDYGPK